MADKIARIDLRVTPEEKKILTAKAAAAGLTITGYVMLCVGAAKIGDKLGEEIQKAIRKSIERASNT